MLNDDLLDELQQRNRDIADWLENNGAHLLGEQKHLDHEASERLYWHHGYATALKDVLRLCQLYTSEDRHLQ